MAQAPPWDSVPSRDTLFVLVTGANSGIGLGICQRLIDEYLLTRSLTSHLVIIPTTRSVRKSRETERALRKHARRFAATSDLLRSRAGGGGPDYDPKQATRRVHVLSVELDLCNLPSIRLAARRLISDTFSSLCGADEGDDADFAKLVDVRIPRLDAVIFNAGIGGWTGLDWPLVFHNILTRGLVQATTWPTFKGARGGHTVDPLARTSEPLMGEVFCANVFGHYLFAHMLLPLLRRSAGGEEEDRGMIGPGRIIWESSIEPVWGDLRLDDFQAVRTKAAYESTKRLTDVLSLTATLPGSRPYVQEYLGYGDNDKEKMETTTAPPKIYLTHPGVVQTTLFPLNAFMFFWYRVVLYIARLLGSPWHLITAYNGACAPVWLALQPQEALDAAKAERSKWGSSTDRWGQCRVKKTEVEGWGWDGAVEDKSEDADTSVVLRKGVGRKYGAVDLTEERRVEFEELGAKCWKEMERLREEWEARMKSSTTSQ